MADQPCKLHFPTFQANVNLRNAVGHTPLHDAADAGKVTILQRLIDAGADVDARNDNGSTPLHLASLWGNLDCVKALLAAGADINAANHDLNTPLHEAAWLVRGLLSKEDKLKCCKLLLRSQADPAAKNSRGKTPVDFPVLAETNSVSATVPEAASI